MREEIVYIGGRIDGEETVKERTETHMAVDSEEAVSFADNAITAGIVDAGKRQQLLLLARHHGIDAMRDCIRVLVPKDTREVLKTCGMSVDDYIAHKAQGKR